jgi:hypothetical protein
LVSLSLSLSGTKFKDQHPMASRAMLCVCVCVCAAGGTLARVFFKIFFLFCAAQEARSPKSL